MYVTKTGELLQFCDNPPPVPIIHFHTIRCSFPAKTLRIFYMDKPNLKQAFRIETHNTFFSFVCWKCIIYWLMILESDYLPVNALLVCFVRYPILMKVHLEGDSPRGGQQSTRKASWGSSSNVRHHCLIQDNRKPLCSCPRAHSCPWVKKWDNNFVC